jgi:hypothetical protein
MTNINVEDFFIKESLKFKSTKQGVGWLKRNLKPESLIRIGPNYLVDKKEIYTLYKMYIKNQKIIAQERAERAKKLTKD